MSMKLKDRVESYINSTDIRLLGKVPLLIKINGRSFSKATSLLDKPYSEQLSECLLSTAVRMCQEVDGAIFAYQNSDEILIVTKNDQSPDTEPWFDNKVQKICSATAAISTYHFNDCVKSMQLNIIGNPIFVSHVFLVPNITETINTIIYKQQENFHTSIQFACFYELIKKYDKTTIKEMLHGLSIDEKIDLLKQECNIDFNDYSTSFRRGAACYKFPKMENGILKNKWMIDDNLPIFTRDQSFLSSIIK